MTGLILEVLPSRNNSVILRGYPYASSGINEITSNLFNNALLGIFKRVKFCFEGTVRLLC